MAGTDIILARDFNSNVMTESHLIDSFETLGLYAANKSTPAHFINSIDLTFFFVNDPRLILLYDRVSVPVFSRHDLIFFTYDATLKIRLAIGTIKI